jgi:adenylate cyclase
VKSIRRHRARIAVTLVPLVLALFHIFGVWHLDMLDRLDHVIYDARLRADMPQTLDDRIVIVDIDEKSLSDIGRWPWGRNVLAELVNRLFDQQGIALLGVDVVFAEPDHSSGLRYLQSLAANRFKDNLAFRTEVESLTPQLDFDALLAKALKGRPVVLGYFFSDTVSQKYGGTLPAPVFTLKELDGHSVNTPQWQSFGANYSILSSAAPLAGHTNSFTDPDGVVRALPLVARYGDAFYESLSLAMFRAYVGGPSVRPMFSNEAMVPKPFRGLEALLLQQGGKSLALPVDSRGGALISFRATGGPQGGAFRYVSAVDVLNGTLPAGELQHKIVLLGTTAMGLFDLRVTPVGEAYPGVETHASVLSSMLDGRIKVKPDYAMGYELVVLVITGLVLAFCLPRLSATAAVILSFGILGGLIGFNLWLFEFFGLVLPLATSLVVAVAAFALNMSYGYLVESRAKRELAHLFGTYVPPELVNQMVLDPDSYSMQAESREMTVMFCDMRGFTRISETMEPVRLQAMLTSVFSRITAVIRSNKGTIDKYMGDCVMAFWGAPVDEPEHARLAVQCAQEIEQLLRAINAEHQEKGLPEIGIGIGINSGLMCVGDMGSDIRRSYTVIGDAVNLGARLEGLTKVYGVSIVASESTRNMDLTRQWQEIDIVQVKGKERSVRIWAPWTPSSLSSSNKFAELELWQEFLSFYRAQSWSQADASMQQLLRSFQSKPLYLLYADRLATMKEMPFNPDWDGSTQFGAV